MPLLKCSQKVARCLLGLQSHLTVHLGDGSLQSDHVIMSLLIRFSSPWIDGLRARKREGEGEGERECECSSRCGCVIVLFKYSFSSLTICLVVSPVTKSGV
jgi:hypothetical protein